MRCYQCLPKSNLHTHTTFSDGKNTAEEVVLSAIQMRMNTLGFSEHSVCAHAQCAGMSAEGELAYRKEILRLRSVYEGQLHILLGIEQDLLAPDIREPYDYIIGSVHLLEKDGVTFPIDCSADILSAHVKQLYGGDVFALIRHYYETEAQVLARTHCDIVGHFDIVTKFNEGGVLFDESDPRYRKYALDALDALLERDALFEINTGAVSRGHRKTPYPSPMLLHRIAEKRGRVTLSADAHSKAHLLSEFEPALQIARAAGLGSVFVMVDGKWREEPIY